MPVLAGALINSNDAGVTVTGFDYERIGSAGVVLATGSAGAVLVHHKMLLDMLVTAGKRATKRVSDAWEVKLSVDGSNLKVEVNGSTFTLALLPMDEYPTIPALTSRESVRVDAATFIRRMDSAMVAVSKDETLPILTSIQILVEPGLMTFLSTDRYRLVLAEMPVGLDVGTFRFLLPGKVWKAWKRVLVAKGSDLLLQFHDAEPEAERADKLSTHRRLTILQGCMDLGTLGTDGEYPRIRSLFPESTPVVFEVDADLLASAVASVAVTAERNTPVRLTYNGTDSLRVDAGTGEDSRAEAFLPYAAAKGNRGFAVCFNPAYLQDALKDFKGETVQFLHDETGKKPATLSVEGSRAAAHLVMPVRMP
jgi:DNA polymerase-3 subunit beta